VDLIGEVTMPQWVLLVPAGSWLVIVAVLVLDLTGVLHRGTGFRWQATGLLVMNTAVDATSFAHHHGWRFSQLIALGWATNAAILAGFATFIVGLVLQWREPPKAPRAG
jgi:hypothetical protein